MKSSSLICAVLLSICSGLALADGPAPAQTAGAVTLAVKTDASSATYHIVHKLHRVDGTSKRVEGRARLQSAGPAQVAIRIPIESFDSANTNRDQHMMEATDAARYPYVELKAVLEGPVPPATFPTTVQKSLHAQLTFHGISQALDIPVSLRFDSADRVVATASFTVSLDAFKVERPSLMFVKIDDAMKIDVALTFAP